MPAEREADEVLCRRAAGGDRDAFRLLVETHERRLRAFLARLGGADLGDELAQEAFLTAWQSLPGFRGEANSPPGCSRSAGECSSTIGAGSGARIASARRRVSSPSLSRRRARASGSIWRGLWPGWRRSSGQRLSCATPTALAPAPTVHAMPPPMADAETALLLARVAVRLHRQLPFHLPGLLDRARFLSRGARGAVAEDRAATPISTCSATG